MRFPQTGRVTAAAVDHAGRGGSPVDRGGRRLSRRPRRMAIATPDAAAGLPFRWWALGACGARDVG
ncbi:hypothetical protein [Streptomyces sp. 142MFCol3.1]|uniref:hypothetical protein n=1 Tax=Streptomyces sp. 142MFCol3.1 TaxID=1172179 RepID=UPI00048A6A1B|nr:hypothetical protein [Streptomyces sp. 142MFCol3.1]